MKVYCSGSQPVGRGPPVGRGSLPGGSRLRLGNEKCFCVSHVSQFMKRYQVLVVELELCSFRYIASGGLCTGSFRYIGLLKRFLSISKKFQTDTSCHFPKISGFI